MTTKPKWPPICDPALDKFSPVTVVEVVEKSADIGIYYPVNVQPCAPLAHFVMRLMRTVTLYEAMGEIMEVMIVARRHEPPTRPLDELVFERRFA
jgi:hypothetical protein